MLHVISSTPPRWWHSYLGWIKKVGVIGIKTNIKNRRSGEGHCSECGSGNLIYDEDSGEIICGGCARAADCRRHPPQG